MSSSFDSLIPDARAFLTDLADNNTRDWFTAQKARYEAELKAPALMLLDHLAQSWGRTIDRPLKTKLFRANRDVRFSKDKTPYNTHLHMMWTETDGPGWFLGIATDYVTAGAGVMGFDKAQLTTWRAAVDGPLGAELQAAITASGARIDPPQLKRVPAPYGADHPLGDLLRRKSLALWHDVAEPAEKLGLVPAAEAAFADLRPAVDLLRQMT